MKTCVFILSIFSSVCALADQASVWSCEKLSIKKTGGEYISLSMQSPYIGDALEEVSQTLITIKTAETSSSNGKIDEATKETHFFLNPQLIHKKNGDSVYNSSEKNFRSLILSISNIKEDESGNISGTGTLTLVTPTLDALGNITTKKKNYESINCLMDP